MVLPDFFEDEPEHTGSVRMLLEDVVSALSNLADITDYQIKCLELPNNGEGYTLDIYIRERDPLHIYFEVKPDTHLTYGLLVENLLRFAERQNLVKGLLNACDN